MKNVGLLLLSLSLVACSFKQPNIKWAEENNIKYNVYEYSVDEWNKILDSLGDSSRITVCLFFPPNHIMIKKGHNNGITFKEYCLNHEIGHMREYLERMPYHSKYAH